MDFLIKIRKNIFNLIEAKKGNVIGMVYDIFMLLLVVLSIIPLMFSPEQNETNSVLLFLNSIEWYILGFFILDYVLRWSTADLKLKKGYKSFLIYPFTPFAIIDFLVIVPTIVFGNKIYTTLRLLRILKITKFFQFSNGFKIIGNVFKTEAKLLGIIFWSLWLIVFIFAILIFNIEQGLEGSEINDFFDALWFAFISVTTIGFGDVAPSTDAGRVITMFFSLFGIVFMSLVGGVFVSGFIKTIDRYKAHKVEEAIKNKKTTLNDNLKEAAENIVLNEIKKQEKTKKDQNTKRETEDTNKINTKR